MAVLGRKPLPGWLAPVVGPLVGALGGTLVSLAAPDESRAQIIVLAVAIGLVAGLIMWMDDAAGAELRRRPPAERPPAPAARGPHWLAPVVGAPLGALVGWLLSCSFMAVPEELRPKVILVAAGIGLVVGLLQWLDDALKAGRGRRPPAPAAPGPPGAGEKWGGGPRPPASGGEYRRPPQVRPGRTAERARRSPPSPR